MKKKYEPYKDQIVRVKTPYKTDHCHTNQGSSKNSVNRL